MKIRLDRRAADLIRFLIEDGTLKPTFISDWEDLIESGQFTLEDMQKDLARQLFDYLPRLLRHNLIKIADTSFWDRSEMEKAGYRFHHVQSEESIAHMESIAPVITQLLVGE